MTDKALYCRAGQLRHPMAILRPEYTQDLQSGETLEAGPYTVAVVASSIEPMAGRELWAMRQSQPEITHRICMRYRSDIGPDYALKYKGRIFRVLECLNIEERNRMLELRCAEQVGGDV